MKFFKDHTIHKSIVMVSKTLESLLKLLPNWKHLVLTHRNLVLPEESVLFHDLPDLLDYVDTINQETMVIDVT